MQDVSEGTAGYSGDCTGYVVHSLLS